MANTLYQSYLLSTTWHEKKKIVFRYRGYRCPRCECGRDGVLGIDTELHVHHLNYNKPLGQEDPLTDLIVLCWMCHAYEHGKIKFDPDGLEIHQREFCENWHREQKRKQPA